MFRFTVLASVLVLAVQGQYHQDPRTAAIISEQRYQKGDGQFGAAYQQEDGTDFQEETKADGTRVGKYSYIDPSGEKRTVSYTAGKNGFQASGDHLPVAPPAPPHALLAAQAQPQYSANSYDAGDAAQFDDGQYDPRYNDPHFQGNHVSAGYQHVPAPAPVQPVQPSYHQRPVQQQPAYVQQSQPAYVPQPQQHQQQQQQFNDYYQSTTQQPHRFQPPGKLSLSRTPDGFSYTFNKV